MFELENGEVIRAAVHAAGIVERRGKTEYVGSSKIVSVRMPLDVLLEVQALSHISGKARNSMIITLLEVGIEEVKGLLQPETLKDLSEVASEQISDVFGEVQ